MNQFLRLYSVAILVSAVSLGAGCGDDDGGGPGVCQTGASVACTCPDGSGSTRTCLSSETWGDCQCGAGCACDTTAMCEAGCACDPQCLCTDTCQYANDGECDDGGPGSDFSECALGTDCMDCGARDPGSTCACDTGAGCQTGCACDPDCTTGPVCGNGTCETGEDYSNCSADCPGGSCTPMGEDCSSLNCCHPSGGLAICQNDYCCGGPGVSCASDPYVCCMAMYCDSGTHTCEACESDGTVVANQTACESCCSPSCWDNQDGTWTCGE